MDQKKVFYGKRYPTGETVAKDSSAAVFKKEPEPDTESVQRKKFADERYLDSVETKTVKRDPMEKAVESLTAAIRDQKRKRR